MIATTLPELGGKETCNLVLPFLVVWIGKTEVRRFSWLARASIRGQIRNIVGHNRAGSALLIPTRTEADFANRLNNFIRAKFVAGRERHLGVRDKFIRSESDQSPGDGVLGSYLVHSLSESPVPGTFAGSILGTPVTEVTRLVRRQTAEWPCTALSKWD